MKEEEEKEGEFDNRHFDDSLKGKTVTKGLFFEKKRKKKDKRVLIRVISVVLSSILLIASNILATYYNTYRTDSNVHDYGYEYYVEVEQNSNYVIQSLPYFENPTCFRILPILKLSISALTLQGSILEPPINTLQEITSIVISEVLSPIVMSS